MFILGTQLLKTEFISQKFMAATCHKKQEIILKKILDMKKCFQKLKVWKEFGSCRKTTLSKFQSLISKKAHTVPIKVIGQTNEMFPVKREIFPGRFKIPKVSQEVKT